MDFPFLTKLLISTCTVGGGSVGAYIAGFTGINKSSPSQELVKLQEKETKEEDSQTPSEISPQQEERSERRDEYVEPSEPETDTFSFSDPVMQQAMEGLTEEVHDEEETFEADVEEEGEQFGDFEEDNGYEEEGDSVNIAEFIKTGNENRELSDDTGPTCQRWLKGGVNGYSINDVSKNDCESLINGKGWGKDGNKTLTVWLNVDQVKAKKVLTHYKLWDKDSSFINKKRKHNWKTCNWLCVRKSSGTDEERFLIECDYHLSAR
ncbi:hypothetical protein [Mycoplasma suis]|uniref:Uncharacterized protein n=1 Tax=Mycoplasma suis (strain Illinois) TaxID=768700 RepID=F0QQL7_MYCSL|nr:hypothetical protein [Mycoplasma suis]ADX97787.1 hypothetical protein MSU_0243 [Mycoplasma suis str. Illinois]